MQGELENDELVMMLVESALERPSVERDDFLQPLCSGTPGLYEEVRRRVDWEERMDGFLCEPLILRMDAPWQPFPTGDLVSGRFRMVRVVGRGGMGVVYEAMDEKLDRRIGIKCAQVGFQNRLPPEARSAREVSHYNVCKVHELHTAQTQSGEVDFITMEFVEGETLSESIARTGPLGPMEAKEIALQLCAGLAQAHRQGVIHGDLKCANVILTKSAESSVRAVLTDFGLAKMKLGDAGSFGGSERGGTLDYMAPELFLREPMTFASDLYALGVVFHVMLTGRAPERIQPPVIARAQGAGVEASKAATVTFGMVREADWVRKIADLPSPWRAIVSRCLAADPASRYGSIPELAAAINPKGRAAKWAVAAMLTVIPAAGFTAWQWQHDNGTTVRLAMLPVSVEGTPIPAGNGIIDDVASRFSGVRGNFLVISSVDAQRNRVDSPQKARAVLGATHALKTSLRKSGEDIVVLASIVEAGSGITMRELKGTYAPANVSVLANALTATITGAFQLRGAASDEAMSPAAYPDYVQGMAFKRRGISQANEAIASFARTAAIDPKSAMPHARLAEIDMQKFDAGFGREWIDRARESIGKALSISPDSYLVLYISGGVRHHSGQYEQAAQDYRRAIDLKPGDPDPWRNLADAYAAMNQPDQAVAAYRKAIEVKPEHYASYLNFGDFYFALGQYQQAEELYRRVTALAPEHVPGHVDLGLALKEQGKFQEAETSLRRALALEEAPYILTNLGALSFSQGRYLEASRFFEKSLKAGPPSMVRYSNLGDAYERLGRSRESAEAYRKALVLAEAEVTLNPRQAHSRAMLASIAANLGDANRAEFELAQALQMEPQNARVRRNAVLTYEKLQHRSKAMDVLRDSPKSLVSDLNRDPSLTNLQKDPQFRELLNK